MEVCNKPFIVQVTSYEAIILSATSFTMRASELSSYGHLGGHNNARSSIEPERTITQRARIILTLSCVCVSIDTVLVTIMPSNLDRCYVPITRCRHPQLGTPKATPPSRQNRIQLGSSNHTSRYLLHRRRTALRVMIKLRTVGGNTYSTISAPLARLQTYTYYTMIHSTTHTRDRDSE